MMQGVLKGSIFLSENDMIRRKWIFHYFLYLSKSENKAYNITLGLLESHHFFFLLLFFSLKNFSLLASLPPPPMRTFLYRAIISLHQRLSSVLIMAL